MSPFRLTWGMATTVGVTVLVTVATGCTSGNEARGSGPDSTTTSAALVTTQASAPAATTVSSSAPHMYSPPTVAFIRNLKPGDFAGTVEEYYRSVIDCMRERGVSVPDPTPGQHHVGCSMKDGCANPLAFKAVTEACRAELPELPDIAVNERNLSIQYDALVSMATCVSKFGVKPAEAPSRQAYIDDRLAGGIGWMPYINISKNDPIYAACDPNQFQTQPFDRG